MLLDRLDSRNKPQLTAIGDWNPKWDDGVVAFGGDAGVGGPSTSRNREAIHFIA